MRRPSEEMPDDAQLPNELQDQMEREFGTLGGAHRRVKRPVEYNLWRLLVGNLFRATVIAAVPGTAAIAATLMVWLGASAAGVRGAAGDTRSAQSAYFMTLEQSQPVLTELAMLGAPVEEIETVWFQYIDADGASRAMQADVLLQVLNDQSIAVRAVHGERAVNVPTLLGPANAARRDTMDAFAVWDQEASSLGGRIAVTIGVAPGPVDPWSRYAGDHPHDK